MENRDKILHDRLIKNHGTHKHYLDCYKIDKSVFKSHFKSRKKCLEENSQEFTVRVYKLFKSKVANDEGVHKWNKMHPGKEGKEKAFTDYSVIDLNGKSVREKEAIPNFFEDLKAIYTRQTKVLLSSELSWISNSAEIRDREHICYYCGISENVLSTLYHDPNYICKTKRKRGAWFELDRKDAKANKYTKDNMVLCCYFCNNHKSDVISPEDMRKYFGGKMFEFLITQYKRIKKTK